VLNCPTSKPFHDIQRLHIAHPQSWTKGPGELLPDKSNKLKKLDYRLGEHPGPFTIITSDEVKRGVWVPGIHLAFENLDKVREKLRSSASATAARAELLELSKKWCEIYTEKLEEMGKFRLCIWPEHCLQGTVGHSVVPAINKALQDWSAHTQRTVTYVLKGQNLRTEMYSALRAEVKDPQDRERTGMNDPLLNSLKRADKVRKNKKIRYRKNKIQKNKNEDQWIDVSFVYY
jgi:nicotinamidase/pyrazinamidase